VKRSLALVPLGHDHHQALEAALRLRRATDEDLDAAVARFRHFWREHGQIRAGSASLDTLDDAHRLGQLLNDHVRFEERELFGLLEAKLEPDQLDRLGREIALAH
jgi:hypothetical protein